MNACRLCLGMTAEMYDIYEKYETLVNVMLSYCNLKVLKNDGLTQYICLDCIEKLEEIIEFINICKESDVKLRAKYSIPYLESSAIKNESNTQVKKENVDSWNECLEEPHLLELSTEDVGSGFSDTDLKEEIICNGEGIKANFKQQNACGGQLCPVCGKYCQNNSKYLQHIRSHGEKKYVCDACSKAFHIKYNLVTHLKTHSDVRKYSCDFCDKMFKTHTHATEHMEYVHRKSRPIPCKVCSKVFYKPQSLKAHMLTHTNERNFKCTLCDKSYSMNRLLTAHMRVHSGECPYECRFCNRKFGMRQNMLVHERLHTGECPFKCPLCSKSFAQRCNMRSHFKYNHKGEDYKETVRRLKENQLKA